MINGRLPKLSVCLSYGYTYGYVSVTDGWPGDILSSCSGDTVI